MKLRRDGRAEKARLEDQLSQINFEIPIVTAALQGSHAAVEASRELSLNPGSSSNSRSSSVQIARANVRLETPAEKTRRAFERGGWDTLKLEEQQWVTVDKPLHPDKYIWLEQRDQEEAERKLQRGKKARANPRKNPAIEQCRFDRLELERIMAEPFADLTRREVHVRKLVHKFHDDPPLVKPDCLVEQDGMNYHHLLAQQTRLKSHRHRTTTEKEWISLDKILNPQASDEQYICRFVRTTTYLLLKECLDERDPNKYFVCFYLARPRDYRECEGLETCFYLARPREYRECEGLETCQGRRARYPQRPTSVEC